MLLVAGDFNVKLSSLWFIYIDTIEEMRPE